MNTKIWLSVSILIVIGAVCAIIINSVRTSPGAPVIPESGSVVACTMDAKLCSDGSAVGRSGPKCEFAACPGAKPKPLAAPQVKPSAAEPTGFAQYKSGVNGVVTLNSKPYATTVTAFRVTTDETSIYAFTQTDQNGLYAFSLPPGVYVLGAGDSNSPQCDHPEVTIGASSMITSNIACK